MEEETGKKRTLDLPARIFLVISEVGAMMLPIAYIETSDGNYSAGLYAYVSYVSVAVYLILLLMAASCELEADGQQEEIRHRHGSDL